MANNTTLLREKDMQKVSVQQKIGKFLVKFALYGFLIFMALVVLFPF